MPRRRRGAALRPRRGPQHLRRTALLPPRNGRRRPGQRPQGVLRLTVQRRRRPVPDETPGTRRPARRLDRPRTRGAAALRRQHGRRTPRRHRAEHPRRGARGPAGTRCASRRRSAGRASSFGHAGCPSSNDHTTLHRRQFSDYDRSDRIRRRAPDQRGRSPLHRPAAARRGRRRHLAQHRHRPLRPEGRRRRPRCRGHLQGRRPPAAAGGPLPGRHRPGQGGRARAHVPRHDHEPSRGVRGPARRRRTDRPGRVLHGRRLGRRRPHRRHGGLRRPRRNAGARAAAETARPLPAAPAAEGTQHRAEHPLEHLPALRPLQRALRHVPGRDHDLLQRALPGIAAGR